MPSNQMFMDTSFPEFTKEDSTDKKIEAIQNYLFLLLEQLRYTLNNLSMENMNSSELDAFVGEITKPFNISLKDGLDKMTQIQATVDGLKIDITQDGNTINYTIGSGGLTISSTRCMELYSLDGDLPPVGLKNGVIVNRYGAAVLGNGWYNAWDEDWIGVPVYVCTTYNGGESWGAVMLRQGTTGLSVMLNNNPFLFAGDIYNAKAGQAVVGVLAFAGDSRMPVTIGTISGHPTGLTTIVRNNGTVNAEFVATATTALTKESGTLAVPVTVGGRGMTLYWSWSVAFRGEDGEGGGGADVTFRAVNNALGQLFKTWSGGTPTTVTDSYIYGPQIKGGEIYGTKIYAGEGNGYSEMSGTGFNLWTELGFKAGIGYWSTEDCEYPYMILGVGTGSAAAGAAVIQKLGAGIWVGDGCVVSAGGAYPGGKDSAVGIGADFPGATGIFIDFNQDVIYRYIKGVPREITGGAENSTEVYLVYS